MLPSVKRRATSVLLSHWHAAASSTVLLEAAAPLWRTHPSGTGATSSQPNLCQQTCSFHSSSSLFDSVRERRLVAAQQRLRRRQEQRAPGAARAAPPPPAPSTSLQPGSESTALMEPPPLAPAAFDLPNEVSLSRVLNRPALIITRCGW